MPNGMLTPQEFEQEKDNTHKINVMYRLIYELYRKRRIMTCIDNIKILVGSAMGAFLFLLGKGMFWK